MRLLSVVLAIACPCVVVFIQQAAGIRKRQVAAVRKRRTSKTTLEAASMPAQQHAGASASVFANETFGNNSARKATADRVTSFSGNVKSPPTSLSSPGSVTSFDSVLIMGEANNSMLVGGRRFTETDDLLVLYGDVWIEGLVLQVDDGIASVGLQDNGFALIEGTPSIEEVDDHVLRIRTTSNRFKHITLNQAVSGAALAEGVQVRVRMPRWVHGRVHKVYPELDKMDVELMEADLGGVVMTLSAGQLGNDLIRKQGP